MSKDLPKGQLKATRINPYTVPEGQHGWRGLSVPGNHKRKWYTVIHNEQVLVTALITLPGETSVRHSHESAELSIQYLDKFQPIVTWHPPGELHGGGAEGKPEEVADELLGQVLSGNSEIERLVQQLNKLQRDIREVEKALQQHLKPDPSPRLLIDILFPPFKTTVDDPRFPPKRTVVGQWYD